MNSSIAMKNRFGKSIHVVALCVSTTAFFLLPKFVAAETPAAGGNPPASPLTSSTTHPFAPLDAPYKSENPLVWDKMEKTIVPTAGDNKVEFTFWATNTSTIADVIVN